MRNLDDDLRDALRREEPPEGFAERVILRAEEQAGDTGSGPGLLRPGFVGGSNRLRASGASASLAEAREELSRAEAEGPALRSVGAFGRPKGRSLPLMTWLAAAAVVVAAAGTGIHYRTAQIEQARAERAQGEAAGQQVVLALQIAGSKLQLVQTKITRMHEQPDGSQ